jgi:hypothetical protein
MTTPFLVGLGIAGAAFGTRAMIRVIHQNKDALSKIKMPTLSTGSSYYRGGFEPKMTRREAAMILGLR